MLSPNNKSLVCLAQNQADTGAALCFICKTAL